MAPATGRLPLIAPLLAVEVGVHRWNLESVLGEHDAIPPDLAAREVDSVIENSTG
jgi:hypothetical protein